MIKQRVLVSGKFHSSDLLVSTSFSNRKIDNDVEVQLDDIWLKKVADATSKGKNIYNGLSYRLNTLEYDGNKLKVDFGRFSLELLL